MSHQIQPAILILDKSNKFNGELSNLFFSFLADDSTTSMEFLLKNKVHKGPDSYQCLVCFKFIKHKSHVKVHMRNQHYVSNSQYYCPACDKWFRIRKSFYDHVRSLHSDWNVSDFEKFRVSRS